MRWQEHVEEEKSLKEIFSLNFKEIIALDQEASCELPFTIYRQHPP